MNLVLQGALALGLSTTPVEGVLVPLGQTDALQSEVATQTAPCEGGRPLPQHPWIRNGDIVLSALPPFYWGRHKRIGPLRMDVGLRTAGEYLENPNALKVARNAPGTWVYTNAHVTNEPFALGFHLQWGGNVVFDGAYGDWRISSDRQEACVDPGTGGEFIRERNSP